MQSPSSGPSTNPFLSSPTNNANQPIVDLFSSPSTTTTAESQVTRNFPLFRIHNVLCLHGNFFINCISCFQPQKASDDLLQLAGNPFADMFGAPQPATASTTQTQNNMWMTNGNGKYEYFILCNLINYVIIVSYNSTKTILNLLFSFIYYHCTFLFGDYCTMIMFFMLFHRSVFIF